ncbi:hypothetical protein ACVU7I_17735, partial [Patulibacter sp. S7RM1-6]
PRALAPRPLDAPDAAVEVAYDARYAGQAFELTVRGCPPDPAALRRAFDAAHRERYGFDDPDAELELVTIRETTRVPGPAGTLGGADGASTVPVAGPAVVRLPGSTVVVPAGWRARTDAHGTLRLDADGDRPAPAPWEAAA